MSRRTNDCVRPGPVGTWVPMHDTEPPGLKYTFPCLSVVVVEPWRDLGETELKGWRWEGHAGPLPEQGAPKRAFRVCTLSTLLFTERDRAVADACAHFEIEATP